MNRWLAGVFPLLLLNCAASVSMAQAPEHKAAPIKVVLLGTGGGPPVRLDRYQASTLVVAGGEYLLFDCGRGVMLRLAEANIPIASVDKLFITHLHSDHINSIPDLYLTGWVLDRPGALQVRGPKGTRSMMDHIQKAFAYDIHVRRDVDEKFPKEGIVAVSTDIAQGVVYEKNGVKVTAFLVDHAPVTPAFGYRVDFAGHSVVLSGDTKFSENLIKYAQGTDVLIHETTNPALLRARRRPGSSPDEEQRVAEAIIAHHTTPEQAGTVFTRVHPKLAVYSHRPDGDLVTPTRKTYAGPLLVGEDLMTITIGDEVEVKRFGR